MTCAHGTDYYVTGCVGTAPDGERCALEEHTEGPHSSIGPFRNHPDGYCRLCRLTDKYLIGISYVGGPEYLKKAIASIGERHLKHVTVVNSSEPMEYESIWDGMNDPWQMVTPMVPLSHTQTHNYIQIMAAGLDAYFVMHNDAECEPDTIDKLLEMLPTLPKKWGVVFTNYDALAMYNPKLLSKVGHWDWRGFPSYYSECDYYYRLKLAGFTIHESGLPVKHVGSHIINRVSKWIKFYTAMAFDDVGKFYVKKWGGHPGHEIFTTPFNLGEQGPYPDE